METYEVQVSSIIHSSADVIYDILADYHHQHPKILPAKYFKSIKVEQGGVGEGTVIHVAMQVLGKRQNLRMIVSEPQPGEVLQEQDPHSGITTWFLVEPTSDSSCSVEIKTSWIKKRGIRGVLEKIINPPISRSIYKQQLELLKKYAENHSV